MGKINVEAEKNELILENEFGDKVIIPAKKFNSPNFSQKP